MSSTPSGRTAAEIVRSSRSNLAVALACLPRQRRQDMYVFYAFCRVVDDIADDPGWTTEQRGQGLDHWRGIITGARKPDAGSVEEALVAVQGRYGIPPREMLEIIDGVAMDIEPRRYATWEELRQYCYRVAGCVGLASIRIFGCTQPQSREYALHLGYALQVTNILRDIRGDWENGERIYLPLEDMDAAGYTVEDLAARRYNEAFRTLMRQQISRAREHYQLARASLTPQDRHPLLAAEAMRRIYSETLDLLEKDGSRVYDLRYRLRTSRKVKLVGRAWLRGVFCRRR